MMEKRSQRKSQKTIQHFFNLLLNEVKIQSEFQSEFFIMSPYFLFSQPQDICCLNDENKDRIMDSYNLAFFQLNLLKNRKTKYIFGYDKFFFSEFPDFYVQRRLEDAGGYLQFIIDLKNKMKMHQISKAFLPIRLNLTQDILKKKNLNEYKVLELINCIPPAVINMKGMSIQFVKSWYAINFFAPLSVQTLIDVDYSLIENSSIANFLTIRSYHLYIQNFTGKTFFSKLKQKIGKHSYNLFSLLSSQPEKFSFDHTVIHLENVIKKYLDDGKYNILRALFPLYIIICVFGVYFFSFQLEITCGHGVSWFSYITYAVFGIITFFIEAYIFSTCLEYVSHLVPELKPNCLLTFPYPYINSIKLFILEIDWLNQWYLNYFVSFVLSQLSRFDFFTNITFLFTTYQCGDMLVFTLALISLSVTTFICIVFYIINLIGSDSNLVTGNIDKLYQICNLLEFQAVADVLDIISPSNSVIIFGKMFNQRIVNNFIRILLQDIPYLIIQVLYLIRKGIYNQTIIFSLVSSTLMFFVSLKHFLTITPSRLGQEDFNQINKIKKRIILPNYQNNLSKYESQIVKFNQYETLKCIRSSKYFDQRLNNLKTPLEQQQIVQQLKMAEELRYFYPNQEFMNEIFGNLNYNDEDISKEQIQEYYNIQGSYFNKEKNQTKKDIYSNESKICRFLKKIIGIQKSSQTSKILPIDKEKNPDSQVNLIQEINSNQEFKIEPEEKSESLKTDYKNKLNEMKFDIENMPQTEPNLKETDENLIFLNKQIEDLKDE